MTRKDIVWAKPFIQRSNNIGSYYFPHFIGMILRNTAAIEKSRSVQYYWHMPKMVFNSTETVFKDSLSVGHNTGQGGLS